MADGREWANDSTSRDLPEADVRAVRPGGPSASPSLAILRLQQLAGNRAVTNALLAVQRTATTQSIGEDYASGLDDQELSAELSAVEDSLRSNTPEAEALAENLRVLRAEYTRRHPNASSSTAGGGRLDTIPDGGEQVNKPGIVNRDTAPELRLRTSPGTEAANVARSLPFNTHVQVIKKFPGDWYFVSTADGDLGYVAVPYIWLDLPEPNATLHRVKGGVAGTAIAIAEQYYSAYADDWGQDLRFYVNALAWVNNVPVPDTTTGWREVHFQAGQFIWVPSHDFARGLKGVVNSGSYSHNLADAAGMADFLDRAGELWSDIRTAIAMSGPYMRAAIIKHIEKALVEALYSLAVMLVAAVAILAISTAIGAAIGALAGGAGAAPGAAAGFEIGMVLLDWLGLAMLVVWIGQALLDTGAAFGSFLGDVWDARGDQKKLDRAARQFAEAVGTLLGHLLEALVMYAASKGLTEGVGLLQNSRVGRALGETEGATWLNERVRRVRSGETPLPNPRAALTKFYRGVELVDAKNSPIGEFDGVDLTAGRFVENKAAAGLKKVNPKTGKPAQTEAQWAEKQLVKKTDARIKALQSATATRPTGSGSGEVPTLAEIQGVRHIHFVLDGNTPALRAATEASLAQLRTQHPGWTFTAEFGVDITVPPVPSLDNDGASADSEED
jgi:hypothetical protein